MCDKYKWIEEYFNDEDKSNLERKISDINDTIMLHIIADNYNWDDGFSVPKMIIENKYCDFGTALMIFYDADGYTFLNKNNEPSESFNEWFKFVSYLYKKLVDENFLYKSIQYSPELTKVQIYKLKKNNPNIPEALLGIEAKPHKLD